MRDQRKNSGGNSHQRAIQRTNSATKTHEVPSASVAKEVETTPGPHSNNAAWYQSTLLWGAFSLTATIVLTVVAAMTKDLRWLLFFAFPFAFISTLEFVSYFQSNKRRRISIAAVASIFIAIGLLWLYRVLAPNTSKIENGGVNPSNVQRLIAQPPPEIAKANPPIPTKVASSRRKPSRSKSAAPAAAPKTG